jgi:methionine-rich copper-binding protein CopC
MGAGVVRDLSGNNFAGITTPTALNFTTAGGTTTTDAGNTLSSATAIALGSARTESVGSGSDTDDYFRFTATSSGRVTANLTGLSDDIDLRALNSSGTQIAVGQLGGASSEAISFNVTYGQTYYLRVDPFEDAASSYRLSTSFTPTSTDTTAPLLTNRFPADNATGIYIGANITLTFNEAVRAGYGNVTIYNANGSVFRQISVTDTSQVSFSGSTMTINPAVAFAAGAGYYVQMGAGVVRDLSGNNFAGITTPTALNFTTAGGTTAGFRDPLGDGTITFSDADSDGFYALRVFMQPDLDDGNILGSRHLGTDWNADNDANELAYAAYAGTIAYASANAGGDRGGVVMINHTLPDGSKYTTVYMHLEHIPAEILNGTKTSVSKNDFLGDSGFVKSGWGLHVHYEVREGHQTGIAGVGYGYYGATGQGTLVASGTLDGISYADIRNPDGRVVRYFDPVEFTEEFRRLDTNSTSSSSGVSVLDEALAGSSGHDVLVGTVNSEAFLFLEPLGPTNIDTILGFSATSDAIGLSKMIFTAVGPAGGLSSAAFKIGSAASDPNDRIIYNPANGALIYDSNGSAAGGAVQFASIGRGLTLTESDFFVF